MTAPPAGERPQEAPGSISVILLRVIGLDPPKEHDVSKFLTAEQRRLPKAVAGHLADICRMSRRLRRERQLVFCGDEDFVPSDEYDAEDSSEAIRFAEAIVGWVGTAMSELSPGG